ncbi:MAG: nucleotide exchange factor GrpE [Clostridia bacterium]|nr:nucleotide exchange factor GrpE [Clostridia bacterium]
MSEKEELTEEKKEMIENTDEVIEIKKQNETLKIQLDETDDRLRRVAAEFDNYKKRTLKEKEGMYESLMGDVISRLLPVIDNLEKAVSSPTEDENYKQGVELVLKQFKDVLTANGVKEIEAVGKTFDPELHEAVSLIQDDNLGEKEIKEEYRKGYMIGDKVIRHSMVVVAN